MFRFLLAICLLSVTACFEVPDAWKERSQCMCSDAEKGIYSQHQTLNVPPDVRFFAWWSASEGNI